MTQRRKLTKNQRIDIYNKYDGRCAYCGNKIKYEEMQVDHIEPLYLGGADDESNYAPACRMCNHYKSVYTVEKFRFQLEELQRRLEKVYIFRLALRYGLIKETSNEVRFLFERRTDRGQALALAVVRDKIEGKG